MAKAYANTRVPFERSIGEVKRLLQRAGVEQIRETQGHHPRRGPLYVLEFVWPDPELPVRFELEVWAPDGSQHNSKENRRAGRFLYWLIKSKLENISEGFRTPLQEFVGEIVTGTETVSQRVERQIVEGTAPPKMLLLGA